MIHEESYAKFRMIADQFLPVWYRVSSEEYTQLRDVAGEIIGETFSVKRFDGTVITVQNRADGRLEIKNSDEPNTSKIVTSDMFCRYLVC